METDVSLAKAPLGSAPDSEDLATLTPAAAKLARASLSPNTSRAYQGALNRLRDYLHKQGRDIAGLTDEMLADYLSSIHEAGASADLQGRFSGHSLRVGSAQSLAAGGASWPLAGPSPGFGMGSSRMGENKQ